MTMRAFLAAARRGRGCGAAARGGARLGSAGARLARSASPPVHEGMTMRAFLRVAAVVAAVVCATAAYAQKSFVREDLASEIVRLEEELKKEARGTPPGRTG